MTAIAATLPLPDRPGHWPAMLSLRLATVAGRTRLAQMHHHGPLRVQRVLHPEGAPAHVLLLHPPGGLVGGDSLDVSIALEVGAHALVTAPAAAKLYGSDGRRVRVANALAVPAGAVLEWLPPETLMFDAACAGMATTVSLTADSRFIGWELTALGRPASAAPFVSGLLDQRLAVTLDGEPLLHERLALTAGGTFAGAPWGLDGATVFGSLLAWPLPADALLAAREQVDGQGVALTVVDGLFVARYRGQHLTQARTAFERLWAWLRPRLAGCPPCPPRIWSC